MVAIDYNRFGAAAADVIELYPGTQASDYGTASGVADATAGTTAIENALDYYSRLAAGALTADNYARITQPTAELIEDCTTAGQTSFQLGMFPVQSDVHLFRFGGWPLDEPQVFPGGGLSYGEIATGDYSVTASTGAITYSGSTAFAAGEVVFATYKVDTADATYSLPSMSDAVIRGAAAELGARLYTEGTTEWNLVQRYRDEWTQFVEAARSGTWLPDELRYLRWWSEAERSDGIGSMSIVRG